MTARDGCHPFHPFPLRKLLADGRATWETRLFFFAWQFGFLVDGPVITIKYQIKTFNQIEI